MELPVGRARVKITVISENETVPAASIKLSECFAGAPRLSGTEYASPQTAIQQGRNEWNGRC